ncbi:F-box domain-containing protein [Mycena indigotica]|uniref:F-box domain-containing protein n=1 Tax=Mycena indigotica TaxID=2126181 RepID=A0A8H6VTA6_9AGAR|nr:F-box domain-containing protein [Mycena indigotica]KAF7289278.1 F-box domain-containing protein [Mycena indigotica]
MALALSDVPLELILEVVAFLELADVFSLLQTCSAFYTLNNDRSLWISVLRNTRLSCPLAASPHTDLSRPQYTLSRLKSIALHKLRLESSWARPVILPSAKPPGITAFDEPLDIIFSAQGTDILLLYFPRRGQVVCWDKQTALAFPFPAIPTGGQVVDVAAPCDRDGASTVAFIIRRVDAPFRRYAHVVTISHDDRKATGIEHSCTEIETRAAHFESIFVSEDVVGCAVVDDIDEHLTLTVSQRGPNARLSDEASQLVTLHRELDPEDMTLSFVYQGHIYTLLEDGATAQIQHFSRNTVLSRKFEEGQIWLCSIPVIEDHIGAGPFCFMLPSTPFYGVSAVFVRWEGEGAEDSTVVLGFLPCALTHASDNGDDSPLSFSQPCSMAYTPGRPANAMPLVWMDHGGFNVAIVVELARGPELKLVRYHPQAAEPTSVHTLDVPSSIDLLTLSTVCLDETAGTLHLVDNKGMLTTFYYT